VKTILRGVVSFAMLSLVIHCREETEDTTKVSDLANSMESSTQHLGTRTAKVNILTPRGYAVPGSFKGTRMIGTVEDVLKDERVAVRIEGVTRVYNKRVGYDDHEIAYSVKNITGATVSIKEYGHALYRYSVYNRYFTTIVINGLSKLGQVPGGDYHPFILNPGDTDRNISSTLGRGDRPTQFCLQVAYEDGEESVFVFYGLQSRVSDAAREKRPIKDDTSLPHIELPEGWIEKGAWKRVS